MTWHHRLRFGAIVGLCCLFLAGCSQAGVSEDEPGGEAGAEPTIAELGLRLVPVELDLAGLSPAEIDQVARGSYLVNGVGGGCSCHTFTAGYLAGGLEFLLPPEIAPDILGFTSVLSRNLTPDPETGLNHTEDEFIEIMRTGKDFADSTAAAPQQLVIMPWHIFRFMSLDDLRAIFAFLRRIPPVRNAVRETFNLPFPPVSFPPIGDGDPMNDPDNIERGLRIPQFFSSGPQADTFVAQFNAAVAALSPQERAKVGRGSYLVNAMGDCNGCHTDGADDENFDLGLIPGTVDVNTALYLAGGVNLGPLAGLDFPLWSRNLTPHPDTGLSLSEEEFIQTIRFGADFRRPGGSLRLAPHFPAEYRLVLDDLKAIYAYLQVIPPIAHEVEIVP